MSFVTKNNLERSKRQYFCLNSKYKTKIFLDFLNYKFGTRRLFVLSNGQLCTRDKWVHLNGRYSAWDTFKMKQVCQTRIIFDFIIVFQNGLKSQPF